MQKPQTFTEITPEQVSSWKEKYKNVFLISTPLDDNDPDSELARFYARRPSVSQMRAISEMGSKKKPGAEVEAGDLLRDTVILGGDMKYLSEDCDDSAIYIAVMRQVADIVAEKKITFKKV